MGLHSGDCVGKRPLHHRAHPLTIDTAPPAHALGWCGARHAQSDEHANNPGAPFHMAHIESHLVTRCGRALVVSACETPPPLLAHACSHSLPPYLPPSPLSYLSGLSFKASRTISISFFFPISSLRVAHSLGQRCWAVA